MNVLLLSGRTINTFALETNFDTVLPQSSVQRWREEKKVKEIMSQTHVASSYTSLMVWEAGVDFHEWLLKQHSITMQKEECDLYLITRLIVMSVVIVYIIYEQAP